MRPSTLPVHPASTALREFSRGLAFLGRGFNMYVRRPRLLLLGTIPALIAMLIIAAALGVLIWFVGDLAALATWFADDWSDTWRTVARVLAVVTILLVALLLSVVTFTALTLIIGDPFYEVISKRVEDLAGGAPSEVELPWRVTIWRNLADSVRMLLMSMVVSVPLFLAGFVPFVGQTVVPVLDVALGGWLLAVEITGVPFNRRGLRLTARRRMLRDNWALALGFGVPVFLLLLIPFAAILVIPAAVAGAALLARELLSPSAAPATG